MVPLVQPSALSFVQAIFTVGEEDEDDDDGIEESTTSGRMAFWMPVIVIMDENRRRPIVNIRHPDRNRFFGR